MFVGEYWTDKSEEPRDPTSVHDAFTRACKGFGPGQQHDAHEALMAIVDKLHDGLSRMKPDERIAVSERPEVHRVSWCDGGHVPSVVSEVFRGQLRSAIEGDGYSSVLHEHFTSLSLSIADNASLASSLQRFMAPDNVEDFKVDGKQCNVTITKRFTYLPRVLIIHLKRFGDGDGEKVDKFVDYPVEMSMASYASPECTEHHYRLFAVCFHRGTATNGHYTMCGEVKGQWFHIDDDVVTKMSDINHIIQKDAYMMLYKRL
jgi:ubiquitin C-terminal hydrolase